MMVNRISKQRASCCEPNPYPAIGSEKSDRARRRPWHNTGAKHLDLPSSQQFPPNH